MSEKIDWPKELNVILKEKDPQQQKKLVEEFCARGKYIRENVGYISGYYDPETGRKILELFETEHPIFGKDFPGLRRAFEIGFALGSSGAKKG